MASVLYSHCTFCLQDFLTPKLAIKTLQIVLKFVASSWFLNLISVSLLMASQEVEMDSNESLPEGEDLNDDSPNYEPRRTPKSSGKWRGYDARRVFKKEWLMIYKWLDRDPDNPTHALCKLCNKKIRAHKGDIEKHERTKRHSRKATTDILAGLIPITANEEPTDEKDISACNQTKYSEFDTSVGGNVNQFTDSDGNQQIIYFTESAPNTTQQTTNTVIDKLVEKYHQTRIRYMKEEHDANINMDKEKLGIIRQQLESEASVNEAKNALMNEQHVLQLKYLGIEHEAKLKAIEDVRDAKLRAIEQELLLSKQEYEKKMQLLDAQLISMRDSNVMSGPKQGGGGPHIQLVPHLNQASLPPNQCLYH